MYRPIAVFDAGIGSYAIDTALDLKSLRAMLQRIGVEIPLESVTIG